MTVSVAVIAALATINPLRLWSGLPGGQRGQRLELSAMGAGVVICVALVLATVAEPILDRLDISDPTARIAAGVAIVVIGVRDAFSGPALVEPALAGRGAAFVPVVVPHLFTPGLMLLVISASADLGVPVAVAGVSSAIVSVVVLAVWSAPTGPWARAVRAGHVLTAGLAIALGGALMLDGVLDI